MGNVIELFKNQPGKATSGGSAVIRPAEMGVNALKDLSIPEILDRILSLTEPGMTEVECEEIINRALQEVPYPEDIFSLPSEALQEIGFPDKAMEMIVICQAIGVLVRERTPPNVNFSSLEDALKYITPLLEGLTNEEFWAFYLDGNHGLIAQKHHRTGTPDYVDVDVDEILRDAKKFKAAALVIAHNHPTGPTEPSEDDINLTATFLDKCKEKGIVLMDHFIISSCSNESTSIREHVREHEELLIIALEIMSCQNPAVKHNKEEALDIIRERGKIKVEEGLVGIAFARQFE